MPRGYNRTAPVLLAQTHRYNHARQMKRKRRTLKQLKTLVGRVYRDIERQLPAQPPDVQEAFAEIMQTTQRILMQQRRDKNKLYSVHAPEVECISKGNKVHNKYEFGVKVGITVTNKSNFVLGVRSFPGNPYDGHTLHSCLEQAEILSGTKAKEAFVDLGYRGVEVPGVKLFKARQKRGVNARIRRCLKRRSAIEPVIGHMKSDGLLRRNYLKGALGDAMHPILCGAGHNIRLILRRLRIFWPEFWYRIRALFEIDRLQQVELAA